ncbi:hypothetical protein MPSEU_000293600 [Mayamaea pseudoterrestris]|nr:hypothetical protein MPSEU_000293600 [Mayamaea pseudoterrestris]
MPIPSPSPTFIAGDDMVVLVVGHNVYGSDDDGGYHGGGGKSSMDVLAAVFFAVAATWLLFALMYALLVILFLRLRNRGELDRVYEADFGRIHLCGNSRCYISFGWILRRYIRHIHPHPHYPAGNPPHLMTRKERRDAMEVLLTEAATATASKAKANVSVSPDHDDNATANSLVNFAISATDEEMQCDGDGSMEGPVCSICLGEYEEEADSLEATTCSHRFHKCCILDWLQRQNNAECPCCRVAMVDEEEVWKVVQSRRDEGRKQKGKVKAKQKLPKMIAASVSSSSGSFFPDEPSQEVLAPTESDLPNTSEVTTDLEALRNMTSCVSVSSAGSVDGEEDSVLTRKAIDDTITTYCP